MSYSKRVILFILTMTVVFVVLIIFFIFSARSTMGDLRGKSFVPSLPVGAGEGLQEMKNYNVK